MNSHYHAPTNTFRRLPASETSPAGVHLSNFDLHPAATHAAAGYYRVASDTPDRPPGTVEDVGKRVVEMEGTECRVARTWVAAPVVEPTPEEQAQAARVEGLRDMYRQSTRAICALAGMEPADKLEDMSFIDARGAAMQADFVTTSVLCDNLTYALFQLYRLDGDDAWSRI